MIEPQRQDLQIYEDQTPRGPFSNMQLIAEEDYNKLSEEQLKKYRDDKIFLIVACQGYAVLDNRAAVLVNFE